MSAQEINELVGYRWDLLPEVGDEVPSGIVDRVWRDRGEYRVRRPPGHGFELVVLPRVTRDG